MPSGNNPFVAWKLLIADLVLGPLSPSIGPGSKPLQSKNLCISIVVLNGATALSAQVEVEFGGIIREYE